MANESKKAEIKESLAQIRKEIGNNIRSRRLQLRMEMKELGSKIGLSQSSITNIEKGRQSITAERLWQITLVLRCSPQDLLPPIPQEFKDYEENMAKLKNEKLKKFAIGVLSNVELLQE